MINYKKILTITVLTTILSTSLIGCKTRLERIQDNINNSKYSDAIIQINKMKNDDDRMQAIDMLKVKSEDVKEEFLSGKIDGTRAISDLNKFKEVNEMKETITENTEEINILMNSQTAFFNGEKAEKENDYGVAFESYHNVSIKDSTNYEQSQAKLVQLENILKTLSPLDVEKSGVIINSTTNKELYPDQMQVILKNKSNRTINKFTVSILGFDVNRNPLEIQSKYSDYKNYEFLGDGDNIISPNETWGQKYGWSLGANHKIKTILACIKDVKFTDGTSWENPLYNSWLEKHNQKPLV